MFIAMHCGGMPFNGDTIAQGKSLGGSESAAYYMARELATLGHHIVLFTNHKKTGRWDGVRYEFAGDPSQQFPLGHRWHQVMAAPYDVVIVQRHPAGFLMPYNSKLNLWWLHDLALHRSAPAINAHLHNIDRILAVSEWHRQQVAQVWGIDDKHIVPTWNAVDYDAFHGLADMKREENSLLFSSRPERGLEELVGDDGIMEHLSDCHLYVCHYDNTTDRMRGFYRYLYDCCEKRPNVTLLGSLGKRELYERMAKTWLCVHPTTFEDTSNITLLEANAAGTPFIGFQTGALPETGQGAGAQLLPLKKNQADRKGFVRAIRYLQNAPGKWRQLNKKALAKRQTWAAAARQWDQLFHDLLAQKSGHMLRLRRHLERMSDIVALEKSALDIDDIEATNPGFKQNYDFYLKGNYADHYTAYYQYERDRGVVYGPESLTGNRRFEAIADIIKKTGPRTVLDYGCAHGHYVVNLAERFKDIEFTGIDIEASNIETAKNWARSGNIGGRALFMQGTHLDVQAKYDVIMACEVLEHVPDPAAVVEKLMAQLNPGGLMIVSVPYGPWEAMGYTKHPGWRAHIHHFERTDLLEMFGDQKNYRLQAVPHNGQMGSWVVTFNPSGEPIGNIDYERKLLAQAPRQTVTACLIVKDGEHTLGKTLQSIQHVADEIIVGIDEATTDDTRRVAEQFGARIIDIKSPLEIGFDRARNTTIDYARMDWILWLDSDETLENGELLDQWLRPNCYDGYAVAQHHFSAQPAGVLKSDFPVRLFRNRRGVKFFGVVHEHPSVANDMNAGVGKVRLLPNVAIMHPGYSSELVRRRRFDRNFPLMRRDRKKYPNRRLGMFLWVRDLAHMIRYNLEVTGGRTTAEIGPMAKECIRLWRKLLKSNDMRMIAESLPYYSEAVAATGGGIRAGIGIDAAVARELPAPQIIQGEFECPDDLREFTRRMVQDKVKLFEEKYF